jgi:hypothetical protein
MTDRPPVQRVRIDGLQIFWQTLAAIVVASILGLVVVFLLSTPFNFESEPTPTITDDLEEDFCDQVPEAAACQPGGIFD